jgi:hypothetical protein
LVHFSAKGLVGGGEATLAGPLDRIPFEHLEDLAFRFRTRGPSFRIPDIGNFFPDLERFQTTKESFFVVEPEVNIMLNITEKVRLGFGGGYRFIGGAGRIDDRLEGFIANASLKLAF